MEARRCAAAYGAAGAIRSMMVRRVRVTLTRARSASGATTRPGLGIRDGDFDVVVGHLVGTLTALGVPEDTIG